MMKWTAVAVTLLILSGFQPAFAQVLTSPAQNPMAGSRVFGAKGWNKQPAMLEAMKGRGISPPALNADEMAHLVAYLDVVRYFASPGDPGRGREALGSKGCLGCHSVSVGGPLVPRNIALARGFDSPAAAISMLWNHVLVKAPGGKREVWSQYRPDEMADLMAWLGSLGAGAVEHVSER